MTHRFRLLGRFLLALTGITLVLGSLPAAAAQPTVGLGTAGSFAVLAASEVTNTGSSVINGNLGVSPGTAITGFPPGTVNGTIHSADATAAQAQADTTAAYNDAAGRTPFTAVATELGGRTLTPGVYRNTTLGLTGTVTLDAQGDPDAVFIFQAGSTVVTATSSRVAVINGAQACNVFWQVGSSATLGTSTEFVGTILAHTSITANTGATVHGRLLARTGAVTLDTNRITRSVCAAGVTTTTTTAAPTTTTSTTAKATTTTTANPTTTTTAKPTTATTAPATTTTTAVTATTPTNPATPTTDATDVGTLPAGTDSSSGTGTAAPAGDPTEAGSDTRSTAPVTATGGIQPAPIGDGSSSTLTELPETGSALSLIASAGSLSMLLGIAMVRWSARG